MIHLILGGVRSGKSSYAEKQAKQLSENVIYVATAEAFDEEMRVRISRHKNDRPENWQLIEAPLDLEQVLLRYNSSNTTLF